MEYLVRNARRSDQPEIEALLAPAVGAAALGDDDFDARHSFVSEMSGRIVGVVLVALSDMAEVTGSVGGPSSVPQLREAADADAVALIRYLAVLPAHHRRGVASALVRAAEDSCRASGIDVVIVVAWLRSDATVQPAASLYERLDYVPGPPMPGFYRDWSIANDVWCPACGDPPCECAARVYVKDRRALAK